MPAVAETWRRQVGLWLIPIRVPTAEVHVHADRRLAFQVLTA